MLVLNTTTDSIQVRLTVAQATVPMRVVSTFRDITTTTYLPGRTVLNTNGITAVTAVGSPAASTQRVVDFISIANTDSATRTVEVLFNDNGTTYLVAAAALIPGDRLEYTDGAGFKVMNNQGAMKNALNQGAGSPSTGRTKIVLSADVTNNNGTANTIQDVTGLVFPVLANNTYYFKFKIYYTAAATTTGSRWTIQGPAQTILSYMSLYTLTATTNTINYLNAYDLPAASNASSAYVGNGNIAIIEGFVRPSADGNIIARFASEIAASAIIAKAGSHVEYEIMA